VTRLQRARLLVAVDWKWTDMAALMPCAVLDWAFMFEPYAYVVAASLLLDGYPTPRTRRKLPDVPRRYTIEVSMLSPSLRSPRP
jgi:hypothetical protein